VYRACIYSCVNATNELQGNCNTFSAFCRRLFLPSDCRRVKVNEWRSSGVGERIDTPRLLFLISVV